MQIKQGHNCSSRVKKETSALDVLVLLALVVDLGVLSSTTKKLKNLILTSRSTCMEAFLYTCKCIHTPQALNTKKSLGNKSQENDFRHNAIFPLKPPLSQYSYLYLSDICLMLMSIFLKIISRQCDLSFETSTVVTITYCILLTGYLTSDRDWQSR